ncbi:hypothetical protein [uncultured Pedobacter sp.]|uniref:hypothetical protein n=1 Tax=uncultured Pedobacter sp. TaxID=246139 RepID=UPI0025DE87E8|nr:hypothetical protein [uncultured Pedobacter sp.]
MKKKRTDNGPEIVNAGKTPVRKPAENIISGAGNQDQLEGLEENAARHPEKHKMIGVSPDAGREPKKGETKK